MLFDVLAMVGAILLVIAVQLLRALLALPFARHRARFVDASPPRPLAGLFNETFERLQALGFGSPRWLLCERVDGEPDVFNLRAVLVHPQGTLAWLAAPLQPKHPHRLSGYFSDLLNDGRTAVSQPYDCFFEATQTEQIVARTAAEPEPAAQWQAHRAWLATLGSPPLLQDDEAILAHISSVADRQRRELLDRGALRAVSADVAVPRLRFALRLLACYLRTPAPPKDQRATPAERIALLARNQEIVRHRAPPRRAQWGLFAVSVALFMGLGALFWDSRFALALLIVVLVHELGHFLAMRAFGYRNVHLLALPLVGGVAIGIDANPAATRRAWMSLAGPLPGIVIGWILLAVLLFHPPADLWQDWIPLFAGLFLFLNYLNVLPIPPLDGAHVVQALLPLRWARIETLFIGSAAVIGAALAWHFDFTLLTVIALLQLPGLRLQWRLHGAERELAADSSLRQLSRPARLLRVLQTLERALGPAVAVPARINQALNTLTRIDSTPMGALARALTAAVYLGLLAVPVLGVLAYIGLGASFSESAPHRGLEQYERSVKQARLELENASVEELLASWSEPGWVSRRLLSEQSWPPAAEITAINDAEARLGASIPDDLRALHAVHDGFPPLDLLPLAEIRPWHAIRETVPESTREILFASDSESTTAAFSENEIAACWLIAAQQPPQPIEPPPLYPTLLWCPPGSPEPGLVDLPRRSRHPSFRAWLLEQAVQAQALRAAAEAP